MLEQYERAVTLPLAAGFARADVMPLLVALENLLLGSALDLAAPETMWELTTQTPPPTWPRHWQRWGRVERTARPRWASRVS